VNITRSFDKGRTWTKPVSIEPDGWESAYSSLAVAPSGRIYCFYCHNLHHIDIRDAGLGRYDMGGEYCFRVSADNGSTWSKRYIATIRDMGIDARQEERFKSFDGKPLRFFWNVSRIWFDGDTFYSPIIKYIYKPRDVIHTSQGVLLRCAGLDAGYMDGFANVKWETLPDGEEGICTPEGGGRVAEEQSYVTLSDGTLFCAFRTIDGHPAGAASLDSGRVFEPPQYLRRLEGRLLKHNRAATFIWPLGENRYFYWFNNQGEKWFQRRNPVWCAIGVEVPGKTGLTVEFGQPEILLYHADPRVGSSYPDLLKDGATWYITETEKRNARLHPIDNTFLDTMLRAVDGTLTIDEAPAWRSSEIPASDLNFPAMPFLSANPRENTIGYTLLMDVDGASPGDPLFQAGNANGGITVRLDGSGKPTAIISEEMANCAIEGSANVGDGKPHRLAVQLDVSANIGWFVIDGSTDDGGEGVCGWRFLNSALQVVPGGPAELGRRCQAASLYARCLMDAEAAVLTSPACAN
jgi:hypothetical protein